MGKTALVLGGGAPNFTLMSGALLALHHAGVKPDTVSMAGGGSVVGLLYLAPKGMTPEQALLNTVNFGVSDLIYSMFPVNYKIFQKPGMRADAFRYWFARLPGMHRWLNRSGMSDAQKLFSDWLQLVAAMMTPGMPNYFSGGLSAHAPFIQNVVDFDALKTSPIHCHLNAYCIEDQQLVVFEKDKIDVRHFRAGLSFPFIYPPFNIDGKHYFEGAASQALGLKGLAEEGYDKFIVLDVLRNGLINRPRTLWEAYSTSIIIPLVALAARELAMFEYWVKTGIDIKLDPWDATGTDVTAPDPATAPPVPPQVDLFQMRLIVPEEQRAHSLSWTKSNLETLFRFGYKVGWNFMQQPENQVLLN